MFIYINVPSIECKGLPAMIPYVTKITSELLTAKKLAENPTNSVIPPTIIVIRQLNTFISILAKGPRNIEIIKILQNNIYI